MAAPGRKRRIALFAGGILLLLVIGGWLFIRSDAFVRSVILPQAGRQLGAEVTADVTDFRPFSLLHLRNIRAQTPGYEPLLQAEELFVNYDLMGILRGNMRVHQLRLVSPVIHVETRPDGSSNLDPIKARQEPSRETEPARLDIQLVLVTNGIVRVANHAEPGHPRTTELSGLFFQAERIGNNQSGTIEFRAALQADQGRGPDSQPNRMSGTANARFDVTLADDLSPSVLNGAARFQVAESEGIYRDLAAVGGVLEADVTPDAVRNLALRFERNNQPLGSLAAQGPFSFEKSEGALNVTLESIDRQALNLVAAPLGIDFATSVFNSTNRVELSRGGKAISINGRFGGSAVRLVHQERTTPRLDLDAAYSIRVDQDQGIADVETLTLAGSQNEQPVLRAELTRPMRLDWSGTAQALDESAFIIRIQRLDLAPWNAFSGLASGLAEATVNVVARSAGQDLRLEIDSQLSNLAAEGAERPIPGEITIRGEAQLAEFNRLTIPALRAEARQQQATIATATISGAAQLDQQSGEFRAELHARLQPLFDLLPPPEFGQPRGTLELKGVLGQKPGANGKPDVTATASVSGTGLTLVQDGVTSTPLNLLAELQLDAKAMENVTASLKGNLAEPNQGSGEAGSFDLTGRFDRKVQGGEIKLSMANLNQRGLGPFLQPMLGNRRLVSVSLDGNLEASYTPGQPSAVNGRFDLANLVVHDPQSAQPGPALSAQVTLDGAFQEDQLDLRDARLTLSPTPRAKNEVQLKGALDFSNRNAITGRLSLVAETLDVTPFHDLYSPPDRTGEPAGPAPSEEPAPASLPVNDFVLNFDVGRFFLREIDLAGFRGTMEIKEDRIVLPRIEPTLNGAPLALALDLNLGVPGYAYDIRFSARNVPLEPLANSFLPERRGQYRGSIIADASLQGAGTTGASLRQHLAGNLTLTVTNASIPVVGPRIQQVLVPIAAILRADEVAKTPLDLMVVQTEVARGTIQVRELRARSEAFFGRLQGNIPIADVLEESPLRDFPFEFHLRRSLAERIRAVPANTPPEAEYVQLPGFIQIAGTLGDLNPSIDERALVGSILDQVIPAIPGLDPKASEALRGLGDLLRGGSREQKPPQQQQPPRQ